MISLSKLLLTTSVLSLALSSSLLATKRDVEEISSSNVEERSSSGDEHKNKKRRLKQKAPLVQIEKKQEEILIDSLFNDRSLFKEEHFKTIRLGMEIRNPKAQILGILLGLYDDKLLSLKLKSGDARELESYLTKSRENKAEEALCNFYMGELYEKGIEGQLLKSPSRAIDLYTQAWNKGYVPAALKLAEIYRDGIRHHVKPDAALAIEWYTKAWDKGDVPAAIRLGDLYKNGIPGHLEPNAQLAIAWYTKAWDKGDVPAAVKIGSVYQDSNSDPKSAIEWYTKAWDKGYVPAAREIADLYESLIKEPDPLDQGNGIIVLYTKLLNQKNADSAIDWYTQAWEKGDVVAAEYLGNLYRNGIGEYLKKNAALAIDWYTKASDKGSVRARRKLAEIYEKGIRGHLEPNLHLFLKHTLLAKSLNSDESLFEKLNDYLVVPAYTSEITKDQSLAVEEEIKGFQENIQQAVGIIEPESMMNDPESTASKFKDSLQIPELLAPYKAIGAYQTKVLTLLTALENPGFLVTWPYIKIVGDQEAIPDTDTEGTFLRRFTVNGQKYLTFGEENIRLSLELLALLKGEDESLVQAKEAIGFLRPLIQKISDPSLAITAETEEELSKVTHLIDKIKEQNSRRSSGSDIEKDPTICQQTLVDHNNNLLTALESVEELQENLKLVFEQTTPLRNQRFVHHYRFPVVEERL